MGVVFLGRESGTQIQKTPEEELEFQLSDVLDLISARKRTCVILRKLSGMIRIQFSCSVKARMMLYSRYRDGQNKDKEWPRKNLDAFANEGASRFGFLS